MELGGKGIDGGRSGGWLAAASIIFFFIIFPVYSQNLVQNGSFEADGGSFADWDVSHVNGDTNYANYSPMISSGGDDDPYYAEFLWEESGAGDMLSQEISTVPGEVYDISFEAEDGAGHNQETLFDFGDDSENLGSAFSIGPGEWYQGWTNFTFSLTATELETDLSFLVYADNGSQFGVDDISVTVVPQLRSAICNGAIQVAVMNCSSSVIIQASTDLIHWVNVSTNTAPYTFTDSCGKYARCFYRAAVVAQ